MNGRIWYCVNKIGIATACNDEQDALETAAEAEKDWPHRAPHRAMRLVDAAEMDELRAENAGLRAELEAVGAGGVQPLRAQAGWALVPVEPTQEMLEAAVQAICYGPGGGFTRISGPHRCWSAMLTAAPKAPQQPAPATPQKPELRVGQVWRTRGGHVVEIVSETENSPRPFVCAIRGRAGYKFTVTKNGTCYESAQHPSDLIELIPDVQEGGEA